MMPGVDGFSLLASLRATESTADLPVLILTAKHITKEDLKVLKRDRIHQLIQKGDVDRAELLASIRAMLEPTVAPPAVVPPAVAPSAAAASATAPAKPRRKTLPRTSARPVILVVEDNEDNALTIRALLQDRYDLLEAADGSQAVELALRGKPALVLMDIALPGLNGIDTFHAIRNHPETKRIPIFALTASAMDDERETILSHGFDAYISKPILADEFYARIEEVLHAR
jgi:CheY-like chemotaxis protein